MEPPEIRYAPARDGTRIAYFASVGLGTPALFIPWPGVHALPAAHSSPAIAACIQAISAGRPQVAFDFRGLGFSGPIGDRLTVAEQAMDIEAVCEAVGEPVDMVAWLTAGFAAVTLAVKRPELVRTLVLSSPDYEGCDSHYGPFWEMRLSMREVEWLEVAMRRGLPLSAEEAHVAARRLVQFAPEEASRAHMRAFLAGSLDGLLPCLTMPTAVLAMPGSQRQSARVAESIPGCTFQLAVEHTNASREHGILVRKAIDRLEASLPEESEPAPNTERNGLSPRELEVLRLLAAGKTNAQIAEALVLSNATVATHVRHILDKTGSANRAEATAYAVRNGLA
jgi:DNA-binding CsgD family transcriptional regulator/pimeloyl-ACP methyl ester carboxylesterase